MIVGDLQRGTTEDDRANASAGTVGRPAFDGAGLIGRRASVTHRIDVEGAVTQHRDCAGTECVGVENLDRPLFDAHVAREGGINRAICRCAAHGGIATHVESAGAPLGQAVVARESADGQA